MADLYSVSEQSASTMLTPNGQIVPAMQVSFLSRPSGVAGKVLVPISGYTPEEVDRLIRAQVKVIEAVQSL